MTAPHLTHISGLPAKLAWVTVPLIVLLVVQGLNLLLLPLALPLLAFVRSNTELALSTSSGDVPAALVQWVQSVLAWIAGIIWVLELAQLVLVVLTVVALAGVQRRRGWGRLLAAILFVLSLLNVPFGTVLGVFGLIGAFDRDVTEYCSA